MFSTNIGLMVLNHFIDDYEANITVELFHFGYFVFLFFILVGELVPFPFIAYNYGLSPFIVSIFLLYPAFGVFLSLIFNDDSIVTFGWCLVLIITVSSIY